MSLNKASLLSSLYSSSVLTRKLCHHRTLSAAPRVANTNTTDMTRVVSIVNTDQTALENVLREASTVLIGGGVIAIPTDTIYGVASLVTSNEGVERIYQMKGRQRGKPLAICVSNLEQVYMWSKVTIPHALLSELLPGPVTTVFERQPQLNPALNPGVSLVGIRIPHHEFVRELVSRCGSPIALTSANISQGMSTISVEEFRELWPSLDLVIDAGIISHDDAGVVQQTPVAACDGSVEVRETASNRQGSTVVDLSCSGKFTIIRQGIYYQQTLHLLKDKYKLTEVVT